nr:phosphofurin acidic cluster sorting protein [Hymenolepis microstoma]
MISMKMSASWEAEKSSSCSIRRLCHIQIGQIILDRPIDLGEHPSNGFYLALRMRGNARRILRSPEISLIVPKTSQSALNSYSPGSGGYILIDLNCTIQYSHVLKMDSNILQLLLQKRKKYKNTTMNLGYKTLAYCNINLSQVLQRRIEHRFLDMFPDPKCIESAIARIEVHCLSTVPWERDPISSGHKGGYELDGCLEDGCLMTADIFSDDADEDSADSDEEADMDCGRGVVGVSSTSANAASAERSGQKKVLKAMSVGQIKQKVVSLLKRLKVADPNEEIDTGTTLHLWEEIDKMETVSDVDEDSDMDTGATGESGSLQSVPRPSIRPFFGHTGSSEETLSLDAGARLLRRLQREALLSPDPSSLGLFQNQQAHQQQGKALPGTSGFLSNETASNGDGELRRHPTGGRGGAGGGVKFSSRFGPMKTRRTVPSTKRRQITSAPSVPSASNTDAASFIPASVQKSLCFNGNLDHSDLIEVGNEMEQQHFEYEKVDEESTDPLAHSDMPVFPESLADVQFVVNNLEPGGKIAAVALTQAGCTKLARVSSFTEVRQVLSGLVSWAQIHRQVEAIRFCIVGGDALLNAVLRAFVEVAGSRSEAVAAAFRFFLVPVSGLVQSCYCSCYSIQDAQKGHIQHLAGCRHRRSSSSTLPPLSSLTSDIVRPSYPGSPSIPRESHRPPNPHYRNAPLSNLIAQRMCAFDSHYSRLFHRLATDASVESSLVGSNSSTPVRGRRPSTSKKEESEFVRRVVTYLTSADCLLPLPIGECLVAGVRNNLPLLGGAGMFASSSATNQLLPAFNPPLPMGTSSVDGGSSLEEESSKQTLVPFLLCIRLGSEAILRGCLADGWDSAYFEQHQRHSTNSSRLLDGTMATSGGDHHPPGAPHLTSSRSSAWTPAPSSQSLSPVSAAIDSDKPTYELQLEYWAQNSQMSASTSGAGSSNNGGISSSLVHSISLEDRGGVGGGGMSSLNTDGKATARPITFKAVCRSMVVGLSNPCSQGPLSTNSSLLQQKPSTFLNLAVVTREKKPKIMRIGKKTSKEVTFKPEVTEGVKRLICTCKGVISHTPSGPFVDTLSDIPRGEIPSSPPNAPLLSQVQSAGANTVAGDICVAVSSTSSARHPPSSFSLRDDLACGLVSSEKNTSSSSGDNVFVRISIDGVDWPTSRFFQVAPGWRTHVKVFPLVCMSPSPSVIPTFALPLARVMALGTTASSVHPTISTGVFGNS